MYQGLQESPLAVLCARVEQGCATRRDGTPITARDGMGWLHRLRDDPNRQPVRPARQERTLPRPQPHLARMADEAAAAGADRLPELAEQIGVSVGSLQALKVGWLDSYADADGRTVHANAWTFPMRDHQRNVVGIRLRDRRGKKWAVPGSTNGLFVPLGTFGGTRLWIVEGPTDTAAMIDLKFTVIGRPSNTAGADYIVAMMPRLPYKEAVIVQNNDELGSFARRLTDNGAETLAHRLNRLGLPVRIMVPPAKDIRDLRNQWNAMHEDVEAMARRTPIIRSGIPEGVRR
jgi:hypothetical protein